MYKCDCCGKMFPQLALEYIEVPEKAFDGSACAFCKSELLGLLDLNRISQEDRELLVLTGKDVFGSHYEIDNMIHDFEDGELRLFEDKKEFFYWIHEDCSKSYLIYLLYNEMNNAEDCIELSNGRVAFFKEWL